MGRVLGRVDNEYRLCFLGDLNGWIGDRTRTGINGAFGVSGENDNGRRVVKFCAERGLCVGYTYFEHWNLHNISTQGRRQGVKTEWR